MPTSCFYRKIMKVMDFPSYNIWIQWYTSLEMSCRYNVHVPMFQNQAWGEGDLVQFPNHYYTIFAQYEPLPPDLSSLHHYPNSLPIPSSPCHSCCGRDSKMPPVALLMAACSAVVISPMRLGLLSYFLIGISLFLLVVGREKDWFFLLTTGSAIQKPLKHTAQD